MISHIVFALVGTVSGFLSGLLGIGGGVIMVPFLIFVFSHSFPKEIYVHCALATSSSSAFFFTLSGMIAHARFKNVKWKNVPYLGLGAFIGALIGSTLASHTPGDFIKKAFAFLLFYVSYRLFSGKNVTFKEDLKSSIDARMFFLLGLITGTIASFFGIGGGVIAVPVMAFIGFDMREAIGTSTAMIPFTTFSSAFGYVINGWNNPLLPPHSLGFVYLPAVLLIVPFGVVMAQIGAYFASRVPQLFLRRIFACLLLIVAVKILFNF